MNRVDDMAAFCAERFPKYRSWPDGRLQEWLRWFIADGRLACITEAGRVVGVGLIRMLSDVDQRRERYHHDESGPIVWVEFGAVSTPRALAALWLECLLRTGWRQSAAFGRCEHNSKIRVYPFSRITRLILTRSLQYA